MEKKNWGKNWRQKRTFLENQKIEWLKFVTKNILPAMGEASGTLVRLIDRVRMLDNDMIRLDQKINTIIEIQNQQMDPFENANQRRKDAQQDKSIDANSVKIEKLKKGKKND